MDPILCFPDPAPAEALLAINEIGLPYRCVSTVVAAEAAEERLSLIHI